MYSDLISRAKTVLSGSSRPKNVFLRRAVSDAYYTTFHALAFLCADNLVGASKRNTRAWRRVYRGLEHGKAKSEFQRSDVRAIDPAIGRIGAAFIQLQEERHNADYDPVSALRRRSDVLPLITLAQTVIDDIENLPSELCQELAATLLIKARA